MKDSGHKVHLTIDGKTQLLDNYVLVVPGTNGIQLFSHSNLFQDYNIIMMLWSEFVNELGTMSDQDVFALSEDLGVDYEALMSLVREARDNG